MVNGEFNTPLLMSVNIARLNELLRTTNAIESYPKCYS